MEWDEERALINAAAAALTERDFAGYDAIKAANAAYDWSTFDYRKAIIEGRPIEQLGPNPMWDKLGIGGTTTKRALDRDKE